MKFLCDRDALVESLAVVERRAKTKSPIPILSHVLIEASDSLVSLTCNDLDSCSVASLPAEISEPGAIALPAERLMRLVSGLSSGATVTVESDGKAAKVRAGRSTYQFSVMPAQDFPELLAPADAVSFELTGAQVKRLFALPSSCVGTEQNRIYLNGIYLHHDKKAVLACATDGHRLMRVTVPMSAPAFEGVIVPDYACKEIVKFTGDSTVTIDVAKALVSVSYGRRRFTTKLIDASFPDYKRVIPSAMAPRMVVDAAEMTAALKRLIAAHDAETTAVVRLTWRANPGSVTASLRSQIASGEDEIECDSPERDPGEIGLNIRYFSDLIDALGGKTVALFIDGPGDAARLENPQDEHVVAVQMPMRV